MDDQDTRRYQPGRGLPTYLLSRNYANSSTDSDDVSQSFAASGSSMTSDEDGESSSISHIPQTFSYMSTSSSFTWSDTTSISMPPSTFQYETSSASRSVDNETRTIRSEMFSTQIEDSPTFNATSSIGEASSTTAEARVSSVALLSGLVIGSMSLTNTNESHNYISSAYDYNAPAISRVEDTFPSYVSLLSNDDHQSHHERNESSGLYYYSIDLT